MIGEIIIILISFIIMTNVTHQALLNGLSVHAVMLKYTQRCLLTKLRTDTNRSDLVFFLINPDSLIKYKGFDGDYYTWCIVFVVSQYV